MAFSVVFPKNVLCGPHLRRLRDSVLDSKANLVLQLSSDSREAAPTGGGFWKEGFMWLVIAVLFLIAWLIAFIAFHVTMAAIHILLGLFVISLIIHFFGRAARHA